MMIARIDNLSSGIFPAQNYLSVTVCPVHALSAESLNAREWVEMAWAARDAASRARNEERRGWFESVKCLLLERDLPPSKIFTRPVYVKESKR
jgi:hypothetical protein